MKTIVNETYHLIVIGEVKLAGLDRTARSLVDVCRSVRRCRRRLETAAGAMWVCLDHSVLLAAVRDWLPKTAHCRGPRDRLLLLDELGPSPVLRILFRVVGNDPSFRSLALNEMFEVLLAPAEEARDLIIGGVADHDMRALSLVRGDLSEFLVPFSHFEPAGGLRPDFRALGFADHGHTVRLGDYEAAADAVLYGIDAGFRSRLNRRRWAEERSFGASLRRLRKQMRIRRTDFPGIDARTIGRIERSEIAKPRDRTLEAIQDRLGMSVEQIGSY